jgi:hypothetical protein
MACSCRFTLILGPVHTRLTDGAPDWVTADQIGAVAAALSASNIDGQELDLGDRAEAEAALAGIRR